MGRKTGAVRILRRAIRPHCCGCPHHNCVLPRVCQRIHGGQNDARHSKGLYNNILYWCLDPRDFLWDFLRSKMQHGLAITMFCFSKLVNNWPEWQTLLNRHCKVTLCTRHPKHDVHSASRKTQRQIVYPKDSFSSCIFNFTAVLFLLLWQSPPFCIFSQTLYVWFIGLFVTGQLPYSSITFKIVRTAEKACKYIPAVCLTHTVPGIFYPLVYFHRGAPEFEFRFSFQIFWPVADIYVCMKYMIQFELNIHSTLL